MPEDADDVRRTPSLAPGQGSAVTDAIRSQRVTRCQRCGLPKRLCLCAELPTLDVRTRIVLVMHRREPLKSSNTARLAMAMIPGALRVVVGARDRVPAVAKLPLGRRLLLFPLAGAEELSPAHATGADVLVVPDGTWPQARRLARRVAALAGVTIVRLPAGPPSRYSLRRNVRPGTVSTFEAIARSLALLEGAATEETMLPWLEQFVRRTLRLRGRAEPSP
jgi:DTW domain-containing protein